MICIISLRRLLVVFNLVLAIQEINTVSNDSVQSAEGYSSNHVLVNTTENVDQYMPDDSIIKSSSEASIILLANETTTARSDGDAMLLNQTVTTTIQKIFLWTLSYKKGLEYEELQLNNPENLISSHFMSYKPTFIIVHGFLGDGLEPWIVGMKDKLLLLSTCNVLSVQWPAGSQYIIIDYYLVIKHVPVVGREIAVLLQQLAVAKGVSNSDVHIVGHSLGAHIAGFVGKNVHSPISRISGLDPAGFAYHNSGPSERLDKTDASYVDVLHTNGCTRTLVWTDCFGINKAIGDTDFWPNGGEHQPACRGLVTAANNTRASWRIGCDHMMSHIYYVESLDYGTGGSLFLARPCDSYPHYRAGNCSCGAVPQYMGYHANRGGPGNYYLNTYNTAPYALPDPACPTGSSYSLSALSKLAALALIVIMLISAAIFSALRGDRATCCCCATATDDGVAAADGSHRSSCSLCCCCGSPCIRCKAERDCGGEEYTPACSSQQRSDEYHASSGQRSGVGEGSSDTSRLLSV